MSDTLKKLFYFWHSKRNKLINSQLSVTKLFEPYFLIIYLVMLKQKRTFG